MGDVLPLEPDGVSESLPLFIEHISVTRATVVIGPVFVNLSPRGIDWGRGTVKLWLVIHAVGSDGCVLLLLCGL
jgi:hypothetical protein